MTTYYARKNYEYTGGDTNFGIPFPYINKDHIKVLVNDEEIENYTFNNDSQITITDTLTVGDIVSVVRNTPIDEKFVTFSNTSILRQEVQNLAQDQVFNAVQEIYDNNIVFEADIDEQFVDYKSTVDSALNTIDGKADTAISTANGAVTTANSANSKADNAVNTANSANSKADNAVSTANTASSNASTAVNTANTAKNTADTAKETADTTKNRVDEFEEDIEVVIEAAEKINELEEAVQTATNAATTASNKADVATNKATEATNAANRAEAAIPSQTGQNGKFLQTNGTSTSWAEVDTYPSQTGQSGKFLTTDGSDVSWATVDALPTQTGQSGKFLTTNGTTASWDTVEVLPTQTGQSGKFLTTDGTDASWADIPTRNIGEIVQSTIPLTDAGLHLLDGALISGSGIYSAFVDYIADLYNSSAKKSNVNLVGSLTNNNGVLSGFSANNYATLPQVFNPASNTWEQVWCFTTGSSVTTDQSIIGGVSGFANPLYRITTNGYIQMLCSTNNSSWDIGITGNSTLTANTKYYIKGSFNGTEYKFELSTDGESFTTVGVVSNTSSIYIVDKQKLGNNNASNEAFLGSIDLKESYSNINGQRWWSGANPSWATDESAWQSSVSTYGVCGKFVYDSVNNTVRLPKITGFVEGTSGVTNLSDLTEAGLPNITGTFGIAGGWDVTGSGAYSSGTPPSGAFINIYQSAHYTGVHVGDATSTAAINLDASRSSSIYGNSNTVQPQSIKVLYYIVIATSTKTDIQVDIDEIATDLNGKANTDLSNVASSKGILTESYVNGTSWYRVYSDGWCEQGGVQIMQTPAWYQITFLKPFVNTNYSCIGSQIGTSIYDTFTNAEFLCAKETTSTMQISINGNVGTAQWTACGYIR